MTRKSRIAALAGVSFLLGAAVSRAKLAHHCRIADSEACVWGKSFFRVTIVVETLVFGMVIFALSLFVHAIIARRIDEERGGD